MLHVADVLSITDWFVICSASNTRLVRTVAEEITKVAVDLGHGKPLRVEGFDSMRWALLDFGDVVVHVFIDEARRYYQLERLWGDVPRMDWQAVAAG